MLLFMLFLSQQFICSDMIWNIFLRISLPDLLSAKLVSRYWDAITALPCFSEDYFSIHDEMILWPKNRHILLKRVDHLENICKFSFLQDYYDFWVFDLDDPFVNFSSCMGLLCFMVGDQVRLFNPCTKQISHLPRSGRSKDKCDCAFGLGFDVGRSVFKVVKINIFDYFIFEVLTLGVGNWKQIQSSISGTFEELASSCNLCGSIHWILKKEDQASLLCFSMSDESFDLLPLSDEFSGKAFIKVLVWDNCIALGVITDEGLDRTCDLYMMKSYKNASSMQKVMTLGADIERERFCDLDSRHYVPLLFASIKELLLAGEQAFIHRVSTEDDEEYEDNVEPLPFWGIVGSFQAFHFEPRWLIMKHIYEGDEETSSEASGCLLFTVILCVFTV